ncbi:transcription termination factor MTERF4, chloroplastic [Dioscorea cayenensis subsp. rotundata]|uniref:Transcription termination factor MTERF4, chloroplastic n=1 Tax=Dioscorea cayennensis subsp. rotundata TaxID=55577 RepID=A0AB40CGT0_DIOCR|nr:transcription termination factor MTERF4, chloroplastic [Dioscorea cayenensis subsp. rotundata]
MPVTSLAFASIPPIPPSFSSSINRFPPSNAACGCRLPIKFRSGCAALSLRLTPIRASAGGEHDPDPYALDGKVEIGEARAAVMELLLESGASAEDAFQIAVKAPKYVGMLVDSVRELDEHCLWSSWADDSEQGELLDSGRVGFRKKVFLIAKKKGNGGVVPLLESIGLKESSSLLIARYLDSQRLPALIGKVKFVKEMLFSCRGQEAVVGRNARRMMMHLSISIDDDIQRTLSFYEKMEARHGGLDMLGYESSFPCIIESFPSLLSQLTEDHFKILAEFLKSLGVPQPSIGIILLLFPPVIFYDMEKEMKPRIHALGEAGVKDDDIVRVLLKYPWILSTSILNNYKKILAFFKSEKVAKSTVDLAIKSWPHILGCSTLKMKSVVEQFGELGVSKKMMAPVITASPQLLLRKPTEFHEVVSLMEEIGLGGKTTGRILCRCPEIFASSVDNTLRTKLDFLIDFGIPRDHLPRVIRKYPELLGLDAQKTLLPRMRFLMEIGLSKREVCSMIVRFSPLLGYSIEVVLKPKLEFLLSTMQRPLKEVVDYPRYFSYSLEKKIKPRHFVLKSRKIECSLKEMLGKNNEVFAAVYMGIGRMVVTPSSPSDGS